MSGSARISTFPRNRIISGVLLTSICLLTIIANDVLSVDLVINNNRDLINNLDDLVEHNSCIPVSIKDTVSGFIFTVILFRLLSSQLMPLFCVFQSANKEKDPQNVWSIGTKMIQISENEGSNDKNILKLLSKEWVYVMSESRILILAMNICKRRPNSRLHISNDKIYAFPRALGLSKALANKRLKKTMNSDINRIHNSGLFELWMNRALNRTLLNCVGTDDNIITIMFTLNLLLTLFKVMIALYCSSILILFIELAIIEKNRKNRKNARKL